MIVKKFKLVALDGLMIFATGAVLILQSGCAQNVVTFGINSISPAKGSIYGGNQAVISGVGFSNHADLHVTINQRDCSSVKVVSDSELHCVTPAGVQGPAVVAVTTLDGINQDSRSDLFTYGCQEGPANALNVWANEGGDKVTQDEMRASCDAASTIGRTWDGNAVKVWGGKNEVVGFNLVLESAAQDLHNVSVSFNQLNGPNGATIVSTPSGPSGIFNWVNRPIELFYLRYVQIKGLSGLGYNGYDERHIPHRLRRPWTGGGEAVGNWTDRPDHDKFYPEIAAPMELHPNFNIASNHNQSVWVDIYVPKSATPGLYSGTVNITADGIAPRAVPVQLTVRNFTLPDEPTAKTMLYIGYTDLSTRYFGQPFVDDDPVKGPALDLIRDRHWQIAHRHKISMIDDNAGYTVWSQMNPRPVWQPRLNGDLFTAANGYDGPGVGVGNGVFSIGNYGNWSWRGGTEQDMWTHTDAWEHWFQAIFPNVDRFLFLKDEPKINEMATADEDPTGTLTGYQVVDQWSRWIAENPGPGRSLKSFSTLPVTDVAANMPNLSIACSALSQGNTEAWQTAVDNFKALPNRSFYMYNGKRPASGSFMIEDDGVSLRELAWGQYKKKVDRWFYWESTYYFDFQTRRNGTGENVGQNNLFHDARTFGQFSSMDPVWGQTGYNYSNGDGVLFYPGTDTVYPSDSYGVQGPIQSLRLKLWRRGIQDVDYLAMARVLNSSKVDEILNRVVPKALWEVGLTDPNDPNYVRTDISWSTNPEDWEAARAELADILDPPTAAPAPTR